MDRRSLRAHWSSGALVGVHEALFLPFLPLLLLAVGGSAGQVALLATAQAAAQFLGFLPGALLARWLSNHRAIVVWTHGFVPRVVEAALVALILTQAASPGAIIGLAAAYNLLLGMGLPAWTSLTADLVPAHRRPRFIASRNIAMQVTMMLGALAGGWVIGLDDSWGFAAAFAGAIVSGVGFGGAVALIRSRPNVVESHADTGSIAPVALPEAEHKPSAGAFRSLLLGSFFFYLAVWIAAPFFNVHLVQELGAQAGTVGVLNMVSTVAGLGGGLAWGAWSSRRSAANTARTAALVATLPPLLWLSFDSPWLAAIPNALGGFAWAGFNLAWFNWMLDVTPQRNRASYAAGLHAGVYLAQAIGPLLGAALFGWAGFPGVVLVSSGGRFLALLVLVGISVPVLARTAREPVRRAAHAAAHASGWAGLLVR